MHPMVPETCCWKSPIIKAESSLHPTYQAGTGYTPTQPAPAFVICFGAVHAVGLWKLLRLLSKRCIEVEHDERVCR